MPSKNTSSTKMTNLLRPYVSLYKDIRYNVLPKGADLKSQPLDMICKRASLRASQGGFVSYTEYNWVIHDLRLWSSTELAPYQQKAQIAASNRAYAALVQAVKSGSAGVGVTIAQLQQTVDMVGLRARQISSIAAAAVQTAAKRERVRKARLKENRRLRRKKQPLKWSPGDLLPTDSANVFLEGLFGWAPLLSSMHEGMEILTGDLPYDRVSRSRSVTTTLPFKNFLGFTPGFTTADCLLTSRVSISADINVDNPNKWLANQLGVINPAVVVWDVVPWSFVVNMFVNVNSLLNSLSDFYGLSVTNACTTVRQDYHEHSVFRSNLWGTTHYYIEETRVFDDYWKVRTLGLTLPKLQFQTPTLSLTSALMAGSLMVQQISGLKFLKPFLRP